MLEALDQAGLPTTFTQTGGMNAAIEVQLEAKACMTAHMKARPRLYDELTFSHAGLHGDSKTPAVEFVMINHARPSSARSCKTLRS